MKRLIETIKGYDSALTKPLQNATKLVVFVPRTPSVESLYAIAVPENRDAHILAGILTLAMGVVTVSYDATPDNMAAQVHYPKDQGRDLLLRSEHMHECGEMPITIEQAVELVKYGDTLPLTIWAELPEKDAAGWQKKIALNHTHLTQNGLGIKPLATRMYITQYPLPVVIKANTMLGASLLVVGLTIAKGQAMNRPGLAKLFHDHIYNAKVLALLEDLSSDKESHYSQRADQIISFLKNEPTHVPDQIQ